MENASMDIFSVVISILAFIVSIYSVYESRKNNLINQDPIIVGTEKESDESYVYEVTNKGCGPAYLISVSSYFNSKRIDNSTLREELLKVLHDLEIDFEATITELGKNTVIAPGETIQIVNISHSPDGYKKIDQLKDVKFGIKILYKSAYGVAKVFATDESLKIL